MFLPTMTNAELLQEAKKDFYELATKARLAVESFNSRHCKMLNTEFLLRNNRPISLIKRTVEVKKWRTRRNNTWTARISFRDNGGGNIMVEYFLYTAVIRERGTEYLFLSDFNSFLVERFTLHFTERYRERYLNPRGIDIGALPTPLYFQMHNHGSIPGRYYKPAEIALQEGQNKKFWIAPQGIYVADYMDGMLTYITFMDKESLGPLLQQVYEEETVWGLLQRVKDKRLDDSERGKAGMMIWRNQRFCEIMERFLKRNYVEDDGRQESIDYLRTEWPKIVDKLKQVEEAGERRRKEEMRKNAQTGTINSYADFDWTVFNK